MGNSLSLEQFKLLAIQYQEEKKKDKTKDNIKDEIMVKKKADEDVYAYLADRSFHIKKRLGYFK